MPASVIEIDVKLSVLRILTERLEQDRKRALEDAAAIKRVPPEILSRIFETAAETSQNIPLRVSLVCHRWRDITLSTPSLFSNISIGNVLTSARLGSSWSFNAQLPYRVQMFLDRSRFADLVLRIDVSKRDHYNDFPVLIQMLGGHLWRCRVFQVFGITEGGLDVVRGMCSQMLGPGARLQELYITASGQLLPSAGLTSPSPLPDHGCLPRLHTLVMEGIHPSSFHVSTPSLRTLRVRTGVRVSGKRRREDTALTPFLELIRHLSQLEELEVDMWGVTMSPIEFLSSGGSQTPTSLPSVQRLKIVHGAHSHHLAPLLNGLSLPALAQLSLASGEGGSSSVLPTFISTLSAPIACLSISTYTLTGSAVLPLLQALQNMPQLISLRICHTHMDAQFLFALSQRIPNRGDGPSRWLSPELRELVFNQCEGLVLADVVRFVEKRSVEQDAASLACVGVWWCIGADQDAVARLRELVQEVSFRGW